MTDQTPQTPPPAVGRMKMWQRILLISSLSLNVLVAAAVLSMVLSHGHGHRRGHHPPRPDMVAGPLTSALEKEDRRAIAIQLRGVYRDGTNHRAALHDEFRALIVELQAQPFDSQAVTDRLMRHHQIFSQRMLLGQQLLVERLATMDAAQRAAYVERLQQGVRRYWKHKKHRQH